MKCSIEGCHGEYEERLIVHTVRRQGQPVVIDHVPAEVCAVCGDVLLTPETVRCIEALLQTDRQPNAHRSLRQQNEEGRWEKRTPAMAAGLTDRIWPTIDLLRIVPSVLG